MEIVVEPNLVDAMMIMREAAQWLEGKGIPLWNPADFNVNKINPAAMGDFYTAYSEGIPAAAMILQWEDPDVWPDARADSGFIHKLAVKRKFAGTGIPALLIDWAKKEAGRRGRTFLRLDCAADRTSLRAIYTKLGFMNVGERQLGIHQLALYETRIEGRLSQAAT